MTRDDFDRLITTGDLPGLVQVSREITDAQRAEWGGFAKEAQQKYLRMSQLAFDQKLRESLPGVYEALVKWSMELVKQHPDPRMCHNVGWAVQLAFCIVATEEEFRHLVEFYFKTLHRSYLNLREQVEVIAARQFPFLKTFFSSKKAIDWLPEQYLLPFIRCGYIDRAAVHNDRYLASLGDEYSWSLQLANRRRSDVILQDYPDLIEDLWLMFESPILCNDFAYREEGLDHFLKEGLACVDSWGSTFRQLCDAGKMDRTRLLTSTLQAIGKDGFSADQQKCYLDLYEDLAVTLDEKSALTRDYAELLSSRAPHAVKFALDSLTSLEKDKRLISDNFYNAAAAVFQLKSKAYSKSVLSLSEKHCKRKPDAVPQAIELALTALTHSSAEIQEQAVQQLERWATQFTPDQFAQLSEKAALVASSLRTRVQALIAQSGAQAATAESPTEPVSFSTDDIQAAASQLPARWRQLSGLDEALVAVSAGRPPGPTRFQITEVPVLTGCEPLPPIQDQDELFDAIAHAVEKIDSADEVERIIDGIARLAPGRPENLKKKSSSLLKRLPMPSDDDYPDWKGRTSSVGLSGENASPGFQGFILSWLLGEKTISSNQVISFDRLNEWQDDRLDEIMKRVLEGKSTVLLSTPTHRGGWIDPRVFVERLCGWQDRQEAILPRDLVLGLLRLAPDGRDVARQAAAGIATQIGRMVRWALGGDEGPTPADHSDLVFWLAAGRARYPDGEIPELKQFTEVTDQPFGASETRLVWKKAANVRSTRDMQAEIMRRILSKQPVQEVLESVQQASSSGNSDASIPEESIQGDCDAPVVAYWEPRAKPPYESNLLTIRQADFVQSGEHFRRCAPWERQRMASVWPLNNDPYFSAGFTAIRERLNSNKASVYHPNHVLVEPLFQPDRPWTEMACLLLALGSLSREVETRSAAVDVLITSISDGRADDSLLAATWLKMCPMEFLKINRISEVLVTVAAVSPMHRWFAADVTQRIIAGLPEWPTDGHHLLTPLIEWLTDLGLALTAEARSALETLKPTAKAAKLTQTLLKKVSDDHNSQRSAALQQALEARLDRAKRWSTTDKR